MNILTYDIKKRKNVLCGVFNETTKDFYKEVNDSHFMRMYQGYGISSEVLKELEMYGCQRIIIKTKNEVRQIPFSIWNMQKETSFGHGFQRFFPFEKMNVIKSTQIDLFNERI